MKYYYSNIVLHPIKLVKFQQP